jgi:hypothetical protein
MKRLIASFVGLGLIAAPALATTTTPASAPVKNAKVHKNKVAKKTAAKAAATSPAKSN